MILSAQNGLKVDLGSVSLIHIFSFFFFFFGGGGQKFMFSVLSIIDM